MPYVTYKGIRFEVDGKGNLVNFEHFSREGVEYNANKIKLKLTDTHGKILEAAYNFFIDLNTIPNIRDICKITGLKSSEILKSFPGGLPTILKFAVI